MLTASTARFERQLDFDIGKVFFYLFMFFSLFLLIDPFYFGYGAFRVTRDLGLLKYFGLMFGIAALSFTLLGQAINVPRAKQPPWRESLRVAWPILLFGLIVLSGSLVGRFFLGIKENFLQLGVSVIGFPIAVILFWSINDHLLVARRFMQGLLLVMPFVIGWVVFNRLQDGQAFHTEIFLFVPLGVYFFLSLKRRWLAWGILLGIVVLGIASHKNTAYLVLLMVLGHLLLIGMVRSPAKGMSIKRVLVIYVLFVVMLVGAGTISFLLANREEYLPSGNVEARSITYAAAINRFLESPIYGQAFLDTGLVQLEGKVILGKNTVVSHSDLLDILSHGGVITAGIFIWGFIRIGKQLIKGFRSRMPDAEFALTNGLLSIVLCGLITAAFNSPLISLPIAVLFWFALGLLVAVSNYALVEQTRRKRQKGARRMTSGSVRYSLVTLLGRYEKPFRVYYGRHPRFKKLLTRPDCEIVIEGYPRCANSFSVLAFERAQQRRMRIGHHLHAPAQIALGVRYGLPVLALIREPISAVASLITRHPEITPEQALRQYVYFYECVSKYGDLVVLADFRKITSNYAEVIEAVNLRFGTAFKPYVNSPAEDEAVFREIDSLNIETEGGAEHQLARPSEAKSALLGEARARIEREPLARRARTVFEQLAPACV